MEWSELVCSIVSSTINILGKHIRRRKVTCERKTRTFLALPGTKEDALFFGPFALALLIIRHIPLQMAIAVSALFFYHKIGLQYMDSEKALLTILKKKKHSSNSLYYLKKYYHDKGDQTNHVNFLITLVNSTSEFNNTTLRIIYFLLEKGTDINQTDSNNENVLFKLFKRGTFGDAELQTAKLLIETGINVNCISNSNITPLICLIQNRNIHEDYIIKLLELLLKYDVNVNHSNNKGRNSLMILLTTGHSSKCVEILVRQSKIHINHLDNNQDNALFILLNNKKLQSQQVEKIVDLLIEAGVNISHNNSARENALCKLLKFRTIPFDGYLPLSRKLIQFGANVNCGHKAIKSCLADRFFDYLSSYNDIELIHASINLLGCELSSKILYVLCETSENPLRIVNLFEQSNAICKSCNPLIALFRNVRARSDVILKAAATLATKATVNYIDNRGNNALLVLLDSNHYNLPQMAQLLLDHQTDVHQVNLADENALIKFCRHLNSLKETPLYSIESVKTVVEKLISNGINVDHVDENDQNALLALFSGPVNRFIFPYVSSAASILVNSGIDLNAKDSLNENVLNKIAKSFAVEDFNNVVKLMTFFIECGVNVGDSLIVFLTRARDSSPKIEGVEVAKTLKNALSNQEVQTDANGLMLNLLSAALDSGMNVNITNVRNQNVVEILCDFYQGNDLVFVIELLCNRKIELRSDDGELWLQIIYCCAKNLNVTKLTELSLLLSDRGLTVPSLTDNPYHRQVAVQFVQNKLN